MKTLEIMGNQPLYTQIDYDELHRLVVSDTETIERYLQPPGTKSQHRKRFNEIEARIPNVGKGWVTWDSLYYDLLQIAPTVAFHAKFRPKNYTHG